MKKIIVLMLLSLIIVGCGNKQQDNPVKSEQKTNDVASEEVIEEEAGNTGNDDGIVITEKEAKVDGEDFKLTIKQNKDGKFEMVSHINAKTEEKGVFALAFLRSLSESLKEETDCTKNYIYVNVGEMIAIYSINDGKENIMGTNRDGSAALGAPDWVLEAEELSEDEMNSIAEEISNAIAEK